MRSRLAGGHRPAGVGWAFWGSVLIAFHKPWGVLSQFTEDGSRNRTLAGFGFPRRVYPVGRLDADSEGLLLLSDDGRWNGRLLHPERGHRRRYWVQVEGIPTPDAMRRLEEGVTIQGRRTLPCRAWVLDPQPEVAPRVPPIRVRQTVPDRWMALELVEGRNRQVRRMTAAVGLPTLRLIRVRIGGFVLGRLAPGEHRVLTVIEERSVLASSAPQLSAVDGLG